MKRSRNALLVVLAAAVAATTGVATAQSAFELKDPANPPVSRWRDDLDGLDSQVRLALLTADDPRTHYVAGRLDSLDIESAVRHFASARVAAPSEPLYLAALATACLQPVQPTLPDCAAVDRLADWARRDVDNGFPQLWLAERARRRNDREGMVAYVQQAADAPRFDDYHARGMLEMWEYFKVQPPGYDLAARAEAALAYGATQPFGRISDAALRTCVEPGERSESLRAACAKLGATMAGRGSSIIARHSGVLMLERNAPDTAARENALRQQAQIASLRGRCSDLYPLAGLESSDAAARARAVAAVDAWVRTLAQYGEAAGCERMLARP